MPNKKHPALFILLFTLLLGGAMSVSAEETFATSLTRYLKLGSVGEDVKTLQGLLASLENIYPEGLITGYYGKLTQKAVTAFQKENNLAAVGIVGPKTIAVANKLLSNGTGSQSAESLTLQLLSLKRDYAKTLSDSAKANLVDQMRTLIAQRKQTILALLPENMANALTVALSPNTLAQFPQEIQPMLEQDATLEGTATILHVDNEDENLSRYEYTLTTREGKMITLHFAKNPPHSFVTGAMIRARGIKIDDELAVNDGSAVILLAGGTTTTTTTTAASATVLPNTFGGQNTLVILVNFQDNPTNQPWTVTQTNSMVFGTVSNFFKENSYNQTWLTGDVAGWYTIPVSGTTCNTTDIATYAKQAATAAGFNLSAYTRYVYIFPANSGCGWSGSGTVGGNPSEAWINGNFSLKTIGHEMGHNFGLMHSHYLECGTSVIGIIGSGCQSGEYGDHFDIMGNYRDGHLTAFQKGRLGWLDYGSSPAITAVTGSGTYGLGMYENSGTEPRALRVLQSTDGVTGRQTWYYLEHRRAVGADAFLAGNANVLNGAIFHLGSDGDANSSYLLDMTPASQVSGYDDWEDPALIVGQTFSDPAAGVTITTLATSTTGATVQITLSAPACAHNNPSVTLSPSSQTGAPGANLSYAVNVTNNDSSACSSSTFTVTPTLPSGFTQSPASLSLSVVPGSTGSGTVTVTSPATAAGGFYTVTETAVNSSAPSYTGTGSATYVVDATAVDTTAPVTSITSPVNGGTIPANSTITITASATDNVGVTRTDFYLKGRTDKLLCSDTVSPYSCTWTVPKTRGKTYQFYARAYDAAGNAGTSATVTVTGG